MSRSAPVKIVTANNLGASVNSAPYNIGEERQNIVVLTALITNGSGAAPTSTPVGTWALHRSADGVTYYPIENADVVTEMTRMNATGNNLIQKQAIIHDVPGPWIMAAYTRGSGGGAGAVCDISIELTK
jgi:hypothetical protein